ncbi:hypothetical protein TNCV_4260561 [Trichonephila clavipes]|nr:hypothetical protein TNCV_4260561 [Trichonephila clavipes]
MQSPNKTKAIVTINAETTEILIANTLATQLLGIGSYYTSVKLSDFILSPEDKFLFSKSDLNPNGELVLFSGKVMDLINSSKQVIPVSVWARKIESDSDFRCVVVMEPVDRITATVKFDHNGKIVSCDENFISVFGFSDPGAATNANITDLIPNVEFGLENNQVNSKQCITGRNGGFIFPLSIQINLCSKEKVTEDDIQEELFYEGTIWVFSNISGLITLLPDGTIHSCNTNFSLLFFGYTQDELVGKEFADNHKITFNASKSVSLFTTNRHLYNYSPEIFLMKTGSGASTLRITYTTLVRPVLEYGYQIFQVASPTNLKKLERVQLSAARIITGLRYSCPTDIVLYAADIQPLTEIRSQLI